MTQINRHVLEISNHLLSLLEDDITIFHIIENAYEYIEKNENIIKYSDHMLYQHQKEIFSICKDVKPKLVLYIAPTGTGKTLTPIGLSEKYKIIFVCAARHVGLALARAAISVNKRVAFGFGCSCADDIRLHYFSAKDYTKNWKTGGIWKVDNSNGVKVEIMICDIKSHLPAMYYMNSFHPLEEIMTYWDEPTITMDYPDHEFHSIIQKNWKENIIQNMVLSSATLPKLHELPDTISDFKMKFPQAEIFNIVSHDCKKSIPIVNNNGYVVLPHYLSEEYEKILEIVKHCEEYLTLLRYFDLSEVVRFIRYVHEKKYVSSKVHLERYFETMDHVDMTNIKLYYLTVLKNIIGGTWGAIFMDMKTSRTQKIMPNTGIDPKGNKMKRISSVGPGYSVPVNNHEGDPIVRIKSEYMILNVTDSKMFSSVSTPSTGDCAIYVTTKDAYTLTDGPTIFLSNDVEKIAKFCIQQANIPEKVMENIMEKIVFNNKINEKIEELEKELEYINEKKNKEEDLSNTGGGGGLLKKKSSKDSHKLNRDNENNSEQKNIIYQLNTLKSMIKTASLNDTFVPNTLSHLSKWAEELSAPNAFKGDISEEIIHKIMLLKGIEDSWKVLLLMGIGVFTNHENITYTEIMKTLADEQKLYIIIASSDYIYGTNYQFCHGYLSKDLDLTQEKIIQAMGRIGRNRVQQDYTVRFRDDKQILKLFTSETDKPEIMNMNKLFNSQ